MTDSSPRPARAGTIRSLLDRAVSLFLVRAELFSIEAREQKEALLAQLLLAFAAFCALLLTMMAGLLLLVVLTPAAWRAWVLAGVTLVAALSCLLLLWRLMHALQHQPPAFATTLQEVRKDCQTLFKLQD
ncbi:MULTISPECIES: phage holin family protein [unclassified Paludibacterium]|uniref:phage holin family protein n=1 Tax=unclassified Paludibacterium TaxID=2618429 RepID=UPI001C058A4D|nr:phage holin family protein [Paludibacterium sp. B53371]BEV71047.1 hypothetical protein THUN1379_05290 [Paludibacterium sp. THUN1379]